jgi:hypothetical protein
LGLRDGTDEIGRRKLLDKRRLTDQAGHQQHDGTKKSKRRSTDSTYKREIA